MNGWSATRGRSTPAGLLKRERIIGSAQGPIVRLADGREMINLCANNYLGLANHPAVLKAAHDALPASAMASHRCASFAAHKACIASWRSD